MQAPASGAHEAAVLWAKYGEVSPMSKGVFEYTDSQNDYAELSAGRSDEAIRPPASPDITQTACQTSLSDRL